MYMYATVLLIWCVQQGVQDEILITNIRKWMFFMGLNGNLESHMFNSYHIFYKKQSCPTKVVFGPVSLIMFLLISSDHL